ncbi:MAG: hypothetical protein HC888_06785 [Candidatus Competibacteraceae bacterium]|nr:hypothetical protein [Candidatus Competibacteraceae bacterium]
MIDPTPKFEKMLVGKKLAEAEKALAGTGFFICIGEKDSEFKTVNRDVRTNRINVIVREDVVTRVISVN